MGKQRTWYLHLLNGSPAAFDGRTLGIAKQVVLVPTLEQLYREQRASADNYGSIMHRYGYVRVRLPEGEDR